MSNLRPVPDTPPRAVLYLRQSISGKPVYTCGIQITWTMPPKQKSISERIHGKYERRGPDDCWPWTAAKTSAGYGHIGRPGFGTGNELAHRAMYELEIGPIPQGAVLDHTCHSRDQDCPGNKECPHRGCVNPAHLEPVTFGENCMRGRGIAPRNAMRTECVNGHPFTEESTGRTKYNARYCKICRSIQNAAWRARNPDYVLPSRRR